MRFWPFNKEAKQTEAATEPFVCGDVDHGTFDEHSSTWKFIRDFCLKELENARIKNDSVLLTAEKTAALRGDIRTLKMLANLPEVLSSRENRLKMSNPPSQDAGGEEEYV